LGLLELHQPDVAVVDSHLADMTGIDFAHEAAEVAPLTALVLHAADLSKAVQTAALTAGFSGIVVRAPRSRRLPDAIITACAGEVYVDPALRD
jgi:DNA-binding NarL/FixJ family response regulator